MGIPIGNAATNLMIESRKVKFVSPADTVHELIDLDELVIRLTLPASGTGYITMPDVEAAAGRIYSIYVISDGGGNVTCEDINQSDILDDDFSAAADLALLYSNGIEWVIITETTT